MAFHKVVSVVRLASRVGVRSLHTTTPAPVTGGMLKKVLHFLDKPLPANNEVGYEKIAIEAEKAGDDPFEAFNEAKSLADLEGTGTKNDPYILYSRNTERIVFIGDENEVGWPRFFFCTVEGPNRSPIDGSHFKLVQVKEDKYGIDELDISRHHH